MHYPVAVRSTLPNFLDAFSVGCKEALDEKSFEKFDIQFKAEWSVCHTALMCRRK
jgi:hypothetical protein